MPSAKRERQREGRQARMELALAEQRRRQRLRTVRNVGIAFVLIVGIIFVLSRGGDDKKSVAASSDSASASSSSAGPPPVFTYGTGPCPNADGSSPRTTTFTDAPQQCIDPSKTYTAVFDTSAGKVSVELDTANTPGTANNFVVLARYHFYDGTQIFRFAPQIGIVQGGAQTNSSTDPGPGYDIPDEGYDYLSLNAGLNGAGGGPYSYVPGDLVMARQQSPNSASTQYFFVVNDAAKSLDNDGTYVKFGSATEGLDVLQAILAMAPDGQPPATPVVVNTVTIVES